MATKKENALDRARLAALAVDQAVRERDKMIRRAVEADNSLRDVADATGVSHMTVKRIAASGKRKATS